jgi:hypothetical protein
LRYLVLLALSLVPSLLNGEEISAAQLKHDFVGSVLALRTPLRGSELIFLPSGQPAPPVMKGSFGRDGILRVEDVRLDGSNLTFSTRREILVATRPEATLQFDLTNERAKLTIVLPSREKKEVDRLLDAVFRRRGEVVTTLTHYNRGISSEETIDTPEFSLSRCKIVALAKPKPSTFLSGRFIARLIINEEGEPEAIAIKQGPKSSGDVHTLVYMLWNWRFAPNHKPGKPSYCTANLGVTVSRNR